MVEAKQRQTTAETTAWRQVRDSELNGLNVGLQTGDFSNASRDPLASQEQATPGYPPTAGIHAAYEAVTGDATDTVTRSTYLTGLELQDAMLEAARRTSAVLRSSRGTALAQLRTTVEDASRRSDHLDDLLLSDDLPIGPQKT